MPPAPPHVASLDWLHDLFLLISILCYFLLRLKVGHELWVSTLANARTYGLNMVISSLFSSKYGNFGSFFQKKSFA